MSILFAEPIIFRECCPQFSCFLLGVTIMNLSEESPELRDYLKTVCYPQKAIDAGVLDKDCKKLEEASIEASHLYEIYKNKEKTNYNFIAYLRKKFNLSAIGSARISRNLRKRRQAELLEEWENYITAQKNIKTLSLNDE